MFPLFIIFFNIEYYLYICIMILILEQNNGERYSEYDKWISHILDINTDKTDKELLQEWRTWFISLVKDINIDVHNHWVNLPSEEDTAKYSKQVKIINKLLKTNDIVSYLKLKYNVIELPLNIINDYYNIQS